MKRIQERLERILFGKRQFFDETENENERIINDFKEIDTIIVKNCSKTILENHSENTIVITLGGIVTRGKVCFEVKEEEKSIYVNLEKTGIVTWNNTLYVRIKIPENTALKKVILQEVNGSIEVVQRDLSSDIDVLFEFNV